MSAHHSRTHRRSWICPSPLERERFLDIHGRLVPLNTRLIVLIVLVMAPLTPTMDRPAVAVFAGGAMLLFGLMQRSALRFARPENLVFLALLAAAGAIAVVAYNAPSEREAILCLLCWPLAGLAGRFRGPVVALGVAVIGTFVFVCEVSATPGILTDHPLRVAMPIIGGVCVAVVVMAFRGSDLEHRGAAALDPLTSLLNRRALMQRVEQLEEQSVRTGEPVGLAVVDLDRFKEINDRFGHAVGDAVLAHVGATLRRELRAYDLAYRLGGEEFAILMPGATLEDMTTRAEDLRRVIAAADVGGVHVTASVGITATARDERFVWADQLERADRAVYEAKRGGRDRVVCAGCDDDRPSGIRRYLAAQRS